MFPSVLAMHDGSESGCNYYRCYVPLQAAREQGYPFEWLPLIKEGSAGDVPEYKDWTVTESGYKIPAGFLNKYFSIVLLIRPVILAIDEQDNRVDNLSIVERIVSQNHAARTITGGDVDDDFFDIAEHNPSHKELAPIKDYVRNTIGALDFMVTTGDFLKGRVLDETRQRPENIHVIPNYINFDLYDSKEMPVHRYNEDNTIAQTLNLDMVENRIQKLSTDTDRPIVIGLQGGASHQEDWRVMGRVLPKIAAKYGKKIRIGIAGYHPEYLKEDLKEADEQGLVVWMGWQRFDQHPATVMSFDINLCPLEDTRFNKSKSPIKFLEASACGAATVASPTIYGDYIKPGISGLIARTDSDWEAAISHLVENGPSRRMMGVNAHAYTRANFSLKENAWMYGQLFNSLWHQHKHKAISGWLKELEHRESLLLAA